MLCPATSSRMGRFPAHDLQRGLLFGVVTYLTLFFRPHFDGLVKDHGWKVWQVDLFVMVLSAIIIFAVYSLLFAKPVLTVRWVAERDYGEQLGQSLPVSKVGSTARFILMFEMRAVSVIGIWAISRIAHAGLSPVVRLGSPPYVRLVGERNARPLNQPGPAGYWGVVSDWEPSLTSGALDCRSVVTFPVTPQNLIAGNRHTMEYRIQREQPPTNVLIRAFHAVLARFVLVKARVTDIYVQ